MVSLQVGSYYITTKDLEIAWHLINMYTKSRVITIIKYQLYITYLNINSYTSIFVTNKNINIGTAFKDLCIVRINQ
jgi:hypothetical protein